MKNRFFSLLTRPSDVDAGPLRGVEASVGLMHEKKSAGFAAPYSEAMAFNDTEPDDRNDPQRVGRLPSMPPLRRISIVPSNLERRPLRRLRDKILGRARKTEAQRLPRASDRPVEAGWQRTARRRRITLALLVLTQTALAVWSLARTFPYAQLSNLEIAILATFAILFAWISFSFWSGIAGFWTLWKKPKSVAASDLDEASSAMLRSRTAVLVPICNEEVERVFAGVEASYRSLADTGQLANFDFYILSDSSNPAKQSHEERAWAQLCDSVGGFGKIFYRRRRVNIKRKSGNIADFIRRWGRNYDHMIVFDADSVMDGRTIVTMARLMDRHPQIGILQTAPTIVNRESLFARLQQFASRVYGPLFSASLRFWQLGESYYWGHNAILRVEPFIKHCGLPRLPGNPPLGGEILSHDFVEAALMGRAGWEVWLFYDLPGSFEESPPTLLDELKRDRRWCQGNLQHLRVILGDGIRFGHRAIMAMGVMAYASAFLWALFLVLSTAEVAVESLIPPVYFSSTPSLFPLWPQWHPEVAIALLSTTAIMLFLPKFLSLLLIFKNGESAKFGGAGRLTLAVIFEILTSMAVAPIRMWFHAKYVLLTLLGREIKWKSQRRDGAETGWIEAFRQHGVSVLVALSWSAGLFWLNPLLAWWILPVAAPMALAPLVSVLSSKVQVGLLLRRWGCLLVPEEIEPPAVIRSLCAIMATRRQSFVWASGGSLEPTTKESPPAPYSKMRPFKNDQVLVDRG